MTLDLAQRRVLVLGLGVSGRSAARFCAQRGASVVAADERPRAELTGLEGLGAGVELRLGRPFPASADFDLVVPSPGIAPARYRSGARSIWGDVELAWRALEIPLIAITGANGKSTTTLLVEALLGAAGLRARAAGNLGPPALSLVGEALDVGVLEVSSFQLETTEAFQPRVAVILNLAPDHIDRHGSFAAYREAKARILANLGSGDSAVLSRDDPAVWSLAERVRGRVLPFSTRSALDEGAWLAGDGARLRAPGAEPIEVSLSELRLEGLHNRENVLAALACVYALGIDPRAAARRVLPSFAGLPHRMQCVGEFGGVRWIDDSKATNPAAALRSLEGCEAPVLWIAGGRDKDLGLEALVEVARSRVRRALLIGEAADKFERALAGRVETEHCGTLDAAVARAFELARQGDVVLLAPACASQDQFRDYKERGERFAQALRARCALPSGAAA